MAAHERSVPELIKTAKALQAKAEQAAGKAEQFYISLGLTLQELKQRKPKDITWPAFVAKHFTLGVTRSNELIRIASGTTTVAEVRAASLSRVRKHKGLDVNNVQSKSPARNTAAGAAQAVLDRLIPPRAPARVRPYTPKQMDEIHRQATAAERKVWLAEHPGRTSAEYTKLLNAPNLDNELGDWRRAKAQAQDDAMRRDWLIEHPGSEPLPEHECQLDDEAARWVDEYRRRATKHAADVAAPDLPLTSEDDRDGNKFLLHDGKRIATRGPEGGPWKPLVPGVRVTMDGTDGGGLRTITVTFEPAEETTAGKLHVVPSPSVQPNDVLKIDHPLNPLLERVDYTSLGDATEVVAMAAMSEAARDRLIAAAKRGEMVTARNNLSELEQAWLVFMAVALGSTREEREAFCSHETRYMEVEWLARSAMFIEGPREGQDVVAHIYRPFDLNAPRSKKKRVAAR